MTPMKLLSAGLLATAMLATPATAREHHAATRHIAETANASGSLAAGFVNGQSCTPAPRVGAFATAPWGGGNVPCEPETY